MSPLLAIVASVSAAAAQPADSWVYGEAGNYCMAFFKQSSTQLVIRFSARTDDDTIQVWRERLPSLKKGVPKRDRAAAAARHFGLALIIADRIIPLTARTGDLKPLNVPGMAYVLGVDQRSFIEALAAGETLAVRRDDAVIVRYRIANHATLASRLAACVASP